ncbi:hypothetical protein AAY473_006861 [Plecturocebus cupreus]
MVSTVAQTGLKLLISNDLPTSTSQSPGITGMRHCAWPSYIRWGFTVLARLVSNSWPQEIQLPQLPKVLGLQSLALLPRLECAMARPQLTATSTSRVQVILPALASQVAGITGTCYQAQQFFPFLAEIGFRHIGQAGLELLTLGDPPASASQTAGITGVSRRTQPNQILYQQYSEELFQFKVFSFINKGVSVARLQLSDAITAHYHQQLLGLSNPPTSASQRWNFVMLPKLVLNSWVQRIHPP